MASFNSTLEQTHTRGVKRAIHEVEKAPTSVEVTFLVAKTNSARLRNHLEQRGVTFSEHSPLFGRNATFVLTANDKAGYDRIEEVIEEFNAIMYIPDTPWAQEIKDSSNLRHRMGYADDVLVFEEIIVTVRKSDSHLLRGYLNKREMAFVEEHSFFNRKVTFIITAEDNRSFPHMVDIMEEFCALAV